MGFWKAKAPEGSQLSGDGWCHSDSQSDQTYAPPSSISKPFNSMNVDELLEALPNCSPEAVTKIWLPVMRAKITTLADYQSSQQQLLNSCANLKTMEQDLKDIAQDAKRIPRMYDEVAKSAGAISDFSSREFKQRLDDAEHRVAELEVANSHLQAEAKLQSTASNVARYDAYALVDSIRPVLEKALLHSQNWDRVQCETMRRLLQDLPDDHRQSSAPSLSLRQDVYHELLSDRRDAQESITALRGLAVEQAQFIKEQSDKLTDDLDRYEHVVESLQTRGHEVLLLDNRNKELEGKLHEQEVAIEQSKQDGAHIAILHDQLMRSKQQYEARLEEKELELAKMRQDFDQIQKQLLVAQVDLRNARTSRALGVDGDGINKPRPSLPSSYSSFALNVRQLTEQSEPRRPQQTYRIQGPREDLAKPHRADVVGLSQSSSVTHSLAKPVRPRRLSDPFEDAPEGGRPRAASLDSEKMMIYGPNDEAKPLPVPPTISPTIRSGAGFGHVTAVNGTGNASYEMSRPSPQFHMRDLHRPETPGSGKRMLSIIAEASQEGSSSQKTLSATSSERNDYRNSISALEMLNSQSSPYSQEGSPVMHASWAETHRRHDPRNASSRDLNVSKMYHQDRQHL